MLAHREKSDHFPEKVVQLPEKVVQLPEKTVPLPEKVVQLPEREASVPESGDVFEQVELGGGIKVGPSIQTTLMILSFKIIPSMLILVLRIPKTITRAKVSSLSTFGLLYS